MAWKRLERSLKKHRQALLTCPLDPREVLIELARFFKALIEVANERGPGFDVIDPFGVWGNRNADTLSPQRVEVKAILPPNESPDGHRVVLTTNEFHRARQHPECYVLRLVYVPKDDENISGVDWAGDILDPVDTLKLREQIVLGVRSGMLPFTIHPDA